MTLLSPVITRISPRVWFRIEWFLNYCSMKNFFTSTVEIIGKLKVYVNRENLTIKRVLSGTFWFDFQFSYSKIKILKNKRRFLVFKKKIYNNIRWWSWHLIWSTKIWNIINFLIFCNLWHVLTCLLNLQFRVQTASGLHMTK